MNFESHSSKYLYLVRIILSLVSDGNPNFEMEISKAFFVALLFAAIIFDITSAVRLETDRFSKPRQLFDFFKNTLSGGQKALENVKDGAVNSTSNPTSLISPLGNVTQPANVLESLPNQAKVVGNLAQAPLKSIEGVAKPLSGNPVQGVGHMAGGLEDAVGGPAFLFGLIEKLALVGPAILENIGKVPKYYNSSSFVYGAIGGGLGGAVGGTTGIIDGMIVGSFGGAIGGGLGGYKNSVAPMLASAGGAFGGMIGGGIGGTFGGVVAHTKNPFVSASILGFAGGLAGVIISPEKLLESLTTGVSTGLIVGFGLPLVTDDVYVKSALVGGVLGAMGGGYGSYLGSAALSIFDIPSMNLGKSNLPVPDPQAVLGKLGSITG